MKPIIEKLPVAENRSFVAATHATPKFEVPWHQHIEYELILFTQGEGTSYVGNYIGSFKTGDIFFLGSNLPHTFQKANKDMYTSAVVVHFKEDFWGSVFMELPETKILRNLFDASSKGIKIHGETRQQLQPLIKTLEISSGLQSIINLSSCLLMIAESDDLEIISTQDMKALNTKNQERIDVIFNYTIHHFHDNMNITQVASHAGMSVPAFCGYFKRTTKKTYIEFLNEVRIGHACKQLIDTQMTVEQVCYDSGYSTLANFNKQFLKIKRLTPSQFRKQFLKRID
jgi:AraC-like DNA-binding protein/quercetin dioxygenase-like cupin family protein